MPRENALQFVVAKTDHGSLSGLLNLPKIPRLSDVKDLEHALGEAVQEVLADWLVTEAGEDDAA